MAVNRWQRLHESPVIAVPLKSFRGPKHQLQLGQPGLSLRLNQVNHMTIGDPISGFWGNPCCQARGSKMRKHGSSGTYRLHTTIPSLLLFPVRKRRDFVTARSTFHCTLPGSVIRLPLLRFHLHAGVPRLNRDQPPGRRGEKGSARAIGHSLIKP